MKHITKRRNIEIEVTRNTTDIRNIRNIKMNKTNNIRRELMNMNIKKLIKKKLEKTKVMNKN